MVRFQVAMSLDVHGEWRVRDTHAIYADSRVMSGTDACTTAQWLNSAHQDGRLRTLDTEYALREWQPSDPWADTY